MVLSEVGCIVVWNEVNKILQLPEPAYNNNLCADGVLVL